MACVTLKRHHEFDPLLSPNSSKRRKFYSSPRAAVSLSPRSLPPTKEHQVQPSPFSNVLPKYSSDVIATKLQDEVKRLQRRRQLPWQLQGSRRGYTRNVTGGDCDMQLSSPTSSPSPPPPSNAVANSPPSSPSSAHCNREQPLFTMNQVSMLCSKLIAEREGEVREEYDKVLSTKLAEQYEAFLKFTYDEIQRRFHNAPMSYVS